MLSWLKQQIFLIAANPKTGFCRYIWNSFPPSSLELGQSSDDLKQTQAKSVERFCSNFGNSHTPLIKNRLELLWHMPEQGEEDHAKQHANLKISHLSWEYSMWNICNTIFPLRFEQLTLWNCFRCHYMWNPIKSLEKRISGDLFLADFSQIKFRVRRNNYIEFLDCNSNDQSPMAEFTSWTFLTMKKDQLFD
jgi:hypothetical protein